MIRDGLFEGLDAALLYHACDRNHVEIAPLASEDVTVIFKGTQSHAASDPWKGRNALDAMIALFVSVGLWRQQLPPDCRVHGIIQEGGTAANIIPDRTRAWFMIRSADQHFYDTVMRDRFSPAVPRRRPRPRTSRWRSSSRAARRTMKHNRALAERWIANARAYGIEDEGMDPSSGSPTWPTSRGSFPTIHPELVDHRRAHGRPHDRVPRRRREPQGGPHDAPGRDARRADGAGPAPRPDARRRRVAGVPRRGVASPPRRPAGRITRTGGVPARGRPATVPGPAPQVRPGGPPWPSVPPRATHDFAARNGWDRDVRGLQRLRPARPTSACRRS